MTPRIYLPPDQQLAQEVVLDAEQSLYLTQALRQKADAPLTVFDGIGGRRQARLVRPDRRRALVSLGPLIDQGPGQSSIRITLIQGVAGGDRMDWVVEKAVELGVTRILPVVCHRTAIKLSQERAEKRLGHWRRIAIAACRQCGRDDLPVLQPVTALAEVLAHPDEGLAQGLRILLDPIGKRPITRLLNDAALSEDGQCCEIALLIGPESGLSDEETSTAIAAGYEPASLGPRVLRTETAGVVAAAIVQATAGDFRD